MQRALFAGLCAAALLTGCDSKVESSVDAAQQARFETLSDCFPGLYQRVEQLLDVVDTWRLANGSPIADPSGLTFAEQGDGTVDLTYVVGPTTLTMTVTFYSPTGIAQDLNLGSPATLNDLVTAAAVALRTAFPSGDSFAVGDWSLAGGGISGNGAVTGVLGQDGSQNTLLELRTTTGTPAGGPPPIADSTVSDSGPPACSLTFSTTGIQIDDTPGQVYPNGTIDVTVTGPQASVDASVTFDGTSTATIVATGIAATFRFSLATRALSIAP